MPKDTFDKVEFIIELISKGYFVISDKEKNENLIINSATILYIYQ